jgi:hypothetical protein
MSTSIGKSTELQFLILQFKILLPYYQRKSNSDTKITFKKERKKERKKDYPDTCHIPSYITNDLINIDK